MQKNKQVLLKMIEATPASLKSKIAQQRLKAVAINELRRKHVLSILLNVAGMAKSSFYYHVK